jgi:L-ascorbate metabolism protein UlaG (beta-lactamase superfamily)
MDIFWLGHAGVRFRSGNTSLIMDPFSQGIGLRIPPQQGQANVVTISSDDPDHSAVDDLVDEPSHVVINGPGEYEASGMQIKGIRTSRLTGEGETAWNTVYVVEIEGMSVCHLGNPDRLLTGREVEELGSPHALVLPVGSKRGLSAEDAVEMVNAISPRIVIPVLYAHSGNKTDLRDIGVFLKELGSKAQEPQTRLTVTRAALPEEQLIAQLQPLGVLL